MILKMLKIKLKLKKSFYNIDKKNDSECSYISIHYITRPS